MAISALTAITPNNYPFNSRILTDGLKIATIALGSAAGTTNSAWIDLGPQPYPTTEVINVQFSWTASAGGNSVNGTVVLQHTSANAAGGANTSAIANVVTDGGSGVIVQGASSTVAGAWVVKLPPSCKQFIRAIAVLPANTGNLADATGTLALLF